jgi:hypothetical protein
MGAPLMIRIYDLHKCCFTDGDRGCLLVNDATFRNLLGVVLMLLLQVCFVNKANNMVTCFHSASLVCNEQGSGLE